EGHGQDFGTEARAAHAQKENVTKTACLGFFGDLAEAAFVSFFLLRDVEPAHPFRFIGIRPKAGIARPQACYFSGGAPVVNVFFYGGGDVIRQRVGLLSDLWFGLALCALLDSFEQLVESFG